MKDIRNRWAVVTGADGGIGLEFCRTLASKGANILLISNRAEALTQAAADIAEDYKVNAVPMHLDLTVTDASQRISQFMEINNIEPYILINNAGIFSFAPIAELSGRKIECFIDLHVGAVTRLSRCFANIMQKKDGGYILNMSSMSCWTPMPGIGMYSATKAYIRVFSRALHYELKDSGISVMAACPGGIATDLFGLPPNLMKIALALRAVATPQKFTRKAVERLLRGRQQYINGSINRLAILMVGITPTPVRMLIKRLMLDKGIRR